MTKPQEPADERLFRAIEKAIVTTDRGAVGIFGIADKRLEHIGSAVLLRVGDETILLTAAHTIAGGLTTTESLVLHTGKYRAPLAGRAYLLYAQSPGLNRYGLDLAIARLEPAAAAAFPAGFALTLDDLGNADPPDDATLCCVVGCPTSRNKLKLQRHPVTIATYTGWGVQPSNYGLLNKDPRAEVLVQLFRTRMYDRRHVPVVAPDLPGMSGGAMWSLGTVDEADHGLVQPRLIGIVTGWDAGQELAIGTHVRIAIEMIRDRMPDLSPLLPAASAPVRLTFTPGQYG